MPQRIILGLSLSLTGAYRVMGRQADAALRMLVADLNAAGGLRVGGENCPVELRCIDDRSEPARCAEIYRSLCGLGDAQARVGVVLGPYSSKLARVAAPIAAEAGMLLINHGGADPSLNDMRTRNVISVLSAADDYMLPFVRLLSTLKFWRKRVAIAAAPAPFARSIAEGFEGACNERSARRRGVRIRLKYNAPFDPSLTPPVLLAGLRRTRINVLASAGSFEHDSGLMRMVMSAGINIPVLACVAAGLTRFGADFGADADGIVGPSQWEEGIDVIPELGPDPAEFAARMRSTFRGIDCDYPAAQAYAAGLLTAAAVTAANGLDQQQLRAAFCGLRTSTLYGSFAIDPRTGRQVAHRMLLVQWHGGRKVVIEPAAEEDRGDLELPPGWRLISSSFHRLKLSRALGRFYHEPD